MKLSLPSGTTSAMPQKYVAWLADMAIATITPSEMTDDEDIEVEVRDGKFLWHSAGKTLTISLAHLYGARVAIRTAHGNSFIGFALDFGRTPKDGGTFLVTTTPEHESWFRELAAKLEAILPGGVHWCVP